MGNYGEAMAALLSLYRRLRTKALNQLYLIKHREKFTMTEFPETLFIENTAQCNAHCTICPRERLTRRQAPMSMELFQRILGQIMPFAKSVKRVDLHGFGEPMIDELLPERIRLVKALGIRHVHIVSNGSKLDGKYALSLLDAGLDSIKFSFYGAEKDGYERLMRGLDYDLVLENINNFLKLRNEGGYGTKVIVQNLVADFNPAADYCESWKSQFHGLRLGAYGNKKDYGELSGDLLRLGGLHNYGDGKEFMENTLGGYRPCYWPFRTMVINNMGLVVPCTYDFDSKIILGDLNASSIHTVWNSVRMNEFRRNMKAAKLHAYSICSICSPFFRS